MRQFGHDLIRVAFSAGLVLAVSAGIAVAQGHALGIAIRVRDVLEIAAYLSLILLLLELIILLLPRTIADVRQVVVDAWKRKGRKTNA